MKITESWLVEKGACVDGVARFISQPISDGKELVEALIADKKLDWANWLIVRIMDYKRYVSYAVYAAEQVIDIYEKKYSNDKRPRKAIEAAKKCIKNPSKENKAAAHAAAYAAYAAHAAAYAAYAAYAAHAAAYAANAAYAAANAAAYAAYAAHAANAAYAADNAAHAAMKTKILKYGLTLIKGKM